MSHLKHIFLKNLFLILKNKIILFKMLLKVPFVSFKGKVSLPTSMLNIVRKGGVAHSNPPLIYIPFLDLDLKVFQTDTGSKPLLDLDSQNRCNLTKSLDFQDPNLKQIQLNSCLPPIFWIGESSSPSQSDISFLLHLFLWFLFIFPFRTARQCDTSWKSNLSNILKNLQYLVGR